MWLTVKQHDLRRKVVHANQRVHEQFSRVLRAGKHLEQIPRGAGIHRGVATRVVLETSSWDH